MPLPLNTPCASAAAAADHAAPDAAADHGVDPSIVHRLFGIPFTPNDASIPSSPPTSIDKDTATPAPSNSVHPETLYNTLHPDGTETFPYDVPECARGIIMKCIATVYKIMQPREFQIFIIYCMVFLTDQMIYLIRKTGEGKSLAFLATAVMLRGVTVVMIPLIGLGSNQVNNAMKLEHGVEAYHIDKNKSPDFIALMDRLLSITKRDNRNANSVVLYCSPQSLEPGGMFVRCLEKLAQGDIITSVWIDESYCIHHDGFNGTKF